ncbi:MAG: hypothetical protein H6812_00560 [Phycisphaeraceae bacterium]|nr:hypothetical protein [Phycisphaerales bacterium]MCB9841727.1 hypothetical protein [Phycisphaeraceae bacterium]
MPKTDRDFLTDYLAQRDEPCPSCRYSLKGLQGNVCPECGQALMLRVGLVEPRLAAWVFGLIGISAGFGFSLLLSIYFLLLIAAYGWDYFGGITELIALFGGLTVSGAELAVWLPMRRRLCRWGTPARWFTASGAATLALIGPIAFLGLVR